MSQGISSRTRYMYLMGKRALLGVLEHSTMAEGAGNPAQTGEKSHENSGKGPTMGMYSLSKQDRR